MPNTLQAPANRGDHLLRPTRTLHLSTPDPTRFYSIGGSLSITLANQVIADAALVSSLKGVVAMVPAVVHFDNFPAKFQPMYKASTENARDAPVIDVESTAIFFHAAGVSPAVASAFTALATPNHAKFPPMYLTACEFDPLRDDAYVMKACLKEAGVPTKLNYYEGLPHYFWIFPSLP
ncbi:hypothetical protein B0A55_04668 [Friedmanniomyces simplex]|uniref:Alpha/beta hydrolase fold-3 domain-containing protein n=1 Tax=Friedmanniomyces simplex TaxID=329884 RepID=A0A4U0Y0W0_9PEZI|nr:hypothetical protein B0A55_04668 [Friedmanniomyces simplex]